MTAPALSVLGRDPVPSFVIPSAAAVVCHSECSEESRTESLSYICHSEPHLVIPSVARNPAPSLRLPSVIPSPTLSFLTKRGIPLRVFVFRLSFRAKRGISL